MANLLAEGFRRLFKGKRFYVCLIVYCCIALLEVVIYYIGNNMFGGSDDFLHVDSLLLAGLTLCCLFSAITAGMLISRDYTNNTIRNKIIIGHSRTNIYLANLIVTSAVFMIYNAAYLFIVICVGMPLVGGGEFPSSDLIKNMVAALMVLLAFSALVTFITMTIKTIGGAVLAIALNYIGSFVGLAVEILSMKYKRFCEFLTDALPSTQLDTLQRGYNIVSAVMSTSDTIHLGRMMFFDVIIIVGTTILGIGIFNKADIK